MSTRTMNPNHTWVSRNEQNMQTWCISLNLQYLRGVAEQNQTKNYKKIEKFVVKFKVEMIITYPDTLHNRKLARFLALESKSLSTAMFLFEHLTLNLVLEEKNCENEVQFKLGDRKIRLNENHMHVESN